MNGSYKIKDFSSNIDSEVKRLKGQVDLFFEKEFKIYQEIGLKDGMKIIECGCGPGFLLLRILERLPQCQVTGLENDPYLFKLLNENIKIAASDIKTVESSITDTRLDNNSYDIVISRLVFEHLPDPGRAFAELFRILKPGGKLIVVSNDFSLHLITYPAVKELAFMYEAYCRSRIDEGGNPYIGRELPGLMELAGFKNISFNVVCAHNKIEGDKAMLQAEDVNISRSLVQKGYLREEILQALAEKWYEMLKTDNHYFARQLYIAGCEKPHLHKVKAKKNKQDIHKNSSKSSQNAITDSERLVKENVSVYLNEKISDAMEIPLEYLKENVPLSNLGLDSLSAIEINNFIKKDFNVDLGIARLLDDLSITGILNEIQASLADSKNIESEKDQNVHMVKGKL